MRCIAALALTCCLLLPGVARGQEADGALSTGRSRFYQRLSVYGSMMRLNDKHIKAVEREEVNDVGELVVAIVKAVALASPQVGLGLGYVAGIPVGRSSNSHIETGLNVDLLWPGVLLGLSVPACYSYRFMFRQDKVVLQPVGGFDFRLWAGGDVGDGDDETHPFQVCMRLGAAFSAGHFSLAYMALPGLSPFTHNNVRSTQHQLHVGVDIFRRRR